MQTKIFLCFFVSSISNTTTLYYLFVSPISITAAAVTVASMYVATGEDDPSEP